jgi:hypothetical protein
MGHPTRIALCKGQAERHHPGHGEAGHESAGEGRELQALT